VPRLSAEARAAELFRTGTAPPPPPGNLNPEAAQLWKQIAASKPPSWWEAGNLRLLQRYCRLAITAERWHDALDRVQPTSKGAGKLLREVATANASLSLLASKLRISVQAQIDRRSGRITERGAGMDFEDGIIGGAAIMPNRSRLLGGFTRKPQ
jgi:hypothetical protein